MELVHFSLQYFEWETEYGTLDGISDAPEFDPTSRVGIRRELLARKMNAVREACRRSDEVLSPWIFRHVTTGVTYPTFEAEGCPFGRDMFYDRVRKYYYILDKIRE